MLKQKFFVLLMCFTIVSVVAQEEKEVQTTKNELKLNTIPTLLSFFDVSYERLLSDDQGLGTTLAFSLGANDFYNFMLTPYYRFYFGEKRAAGFFMEANASVFSEKVYDYGYDYFDSDLDEYVYVEGEGGLNKLGAGLGLAVGGKFLSKNGWVAEIYAGFGRNFINHDDDYYISEMYPRWGVTLGKRF